MGEAGGLQGVAGAAPASGAAEWRRGRARERPAQRQGKGGVVVAQSWGADAGIPTARAAVKGWGSAHNLPAARISRGAQKWSPDTSPRASGRARSPRRALYRRATQGFFSPPRGARTGANASATRPGAGAPAGAAGAASPAAAAAGPASLSPA